MQPLFVWHPVDVSSAKSTLWTLAGADVNKNNSQLD
jgi:hypothetical protein